MPLAGDTICQCCALHYSMNTPTLHYKRFLRYMSIVQLVQCSLFIYERNVHQDLHRDCPTRDLLFVSATLSSYSSVNSLSYHTLAMSPCFALAHTTRAPPAQFLLKWDFAKCASHPVYRQAKGLSVRVHREASVVRLPDSIAM